VRATFASKAESIRSLSGGSAKAQRPSGPAAERAEGVARGHPAGGHRGLLLPRVLAPIALDLDDHVEQVAIAKEDATTPDKRKGRR